MKKKLFFLLIVPLLIGGISGCVKYNGRGKSHKTSSVPETSSVIPSTSNSSSANNQGKSSKPASDELPVGTDVKIYLVFGEYGLYKNNPVNTNVESLFLEHTMELDAKVGDRLPTRDDVTSSVSGSIFVAWTSYNNDGKLTEYTKVPGYQNKILYASFSNGSSSNSSQPSGGSSSSSGGNSQSSSSQTPVTNVTYTVTSLPDWIQNDGCVIFAWVWGPNDSGSWKSLTFGTNNDASFVVPSELTGFLLARCASGTTTPDWNKSDDGAGRVYNKTNNIDCSAGVYSYACAGWVDYPS